ncbi:MAG: hypothetical protein NTV51_14735 [Verrucomicrobia bacterium]|nr:hypothetical protein [Verrucomicrobiota bacterium]
MTLVRADSGFCTHGMIAALEARGLQYILTAALRTPVRTLCRHDDTAWTPTAVPGIEAQDSTHDGSRLVVLRQRIVERPHAGGKQLRAVPGDKFQALRTNLPPCVSALDVWRRYNGRADIENRIKELGTTHHPALAPVFLRRGLPSRRRQALPQARRRLASTPPLVARAPPPNE